MGLKGGGQRRGETSKETGRDEATVADGEMRGGDREAMTTNQAGRQRDSSCQTEGRGARSTRRRGLVLCWVRDAPRGPPGASTLYPQSTDWIIGAYCNILGVVDWPCALLA